jgi:glyoxylase-like metal-dependent hydrolase (beta-lactamase superfamily II)
VDVERVAEGLWRWTGLHPEWRSPEHDLPHEVGCVYHEARDAVVLVDPLIPPEDRVRFLEALDRDVARAQRPVEILLTSPWHVRSSAELAERYGAGVRVPEWARPVLEVAIPYAFGEALPGGVVPFDAHFHGEALLWLPDQGALVAGDVLAVFGDELRLAPDDWLPERERDGRIRHSLRFLAGLPVERVLVGHGHPVLDGAPAELARLLGASPRAQEGEL